MIQYSTLFFSVIKKDAALRRSLRRNIGYLVKLLLSVYLQRKYNKLITINLTEHIGDVIASEPIAYHVRKLHPKACIIWSVNKQYKELVCYNPNINAVMELTCLTEWIIIKKIFRPFVRIYDLHINGKRCSTHRICNKNLTARTLDFDNYLNHGNLLQVGAMAGGIKDLPDYQPKFHFRDPQQPRLIKSDYIVLHTLSNEDERNWSAKKWNELVKRILAKYPSIHIVEIGLSNVIESNSVRYHNYTSKLDLQEIAHLIDTSVLFIGVESGFAHIANALSKNSIILIGYFQRFKNYMVYSGDFARGKNVGLLYYQGKLENLETDEVTEAVNARLQVTESTVVL